MSHRLAGICPLSEFDVELQAGDNHRAAVAVIARVVDALQVHRGKQAAPKMRGVVRLENILAAVRESAVANKKVPSAESEVRSEESNPRKSFSEANGPRNKSGGPNANRPAA